MQSFKPDLFDYAWHEMYYAVIVLSIGLWDVKDPMLSRQSAHS
jgi:hypothetical protein